MDFYLVLTWVVLAVVESTLCPDEEGLKVVPVCTAQTANGRDVAISTNGTQHIAAESCHCTVAVYAVDDTPTPTLYYQGPGYPRCGLEIDVGGYPFDCFDGSLDLIEEEYEITYTNTIRNKSPEACLLFYSGGRNVEYRVTCEQPLITITNSPPTTTEKNQTSSTSQPTSATSQSATTTSASTSTPSSTEISDISEAMNITTSSKETTVTTDDKLSTTSPYTLTTEDGDTYDSTTSSRPSTNEITSQTSTSHPTTTSFEVSSSTVSSTVTATQVQSTSETLPLSATTTSNLLPTETSTEASKPTKPSSSTVKITVTTLDTGQSSSTQTLDEATSASTSTFITTTTGNRTIDLGAVLVKEDEFPFALVVSLCAAFLILSVVVIVFFFVRRNNAKRTSIPWNVNRSEPNPYIDAFSPEQSIATDEEVYFTGLPVIPDIPDSHVTDNHVTDNHVSGPNTIQYSYIDESLTTPRETDIYAVVMKRPDSFVSLPRPKLKSFQGMEDPIEGSDIEDELLEIIEQESKQSGSRVSLNESNSFFDVEADGVANDQGIRNEHDANHRSFSFRETMKLHNDRDIFTNKTPDMHAETGRVVQEMPMRSPRAVSFRETIQVSNGEIVFNTRKPNNIQLMDSTTKKDHVKVHKSTSFEETFNRSNETTNIDPKLQKDNRTPKVFRSVSQNPQDHIHDDKDTRYDANMPRKERRRSQLSRSVSENPQDHLREMFLRDLRKAFKKRQKERHAF